jgi:hypothetical protein
MKRATAHATDGEATHVYPRTVERATGPDSPPLYAVCTRKSSGEWKTFDEFTCPRIANEVEAILKSFGAETRIELIPTPIIR